MTLTSTQRLAGVALSRREAGWVLRRCSRRGHVLAWVDDPPVAAQLEDRAEAADDGLTRCLRCGTWVRPGDALVGEAVGGRADRVPLADVPLAVRGSHGRKFALLRLLAVERFVRGLAMVVGSFAVFHVASTRSSLLAWVERMVVAAGPLGQELGLHLTSSPIVRWVERTLGGDGSSIRLAAIALLLYGGVQVVEGVGLWGGWRWAEYLTVVATSLFVPLEVYELVENATALKGAALVVNLTAVAYLVYKGRLFGARGGHPAYLDELRASTLLGDVLRGLGRSPAEQAGERIV